jgi:hypothetical protein
MAKKGGGNGRRPGRPPGSGRKELPGDGVTIANAYDQLETMAGLGLTRKMMALILGVSQDTLTRREAEDPELLRRLERGEAMAGAEIAQCLWNLATGKIRMVEPAAGKRPERVYELAPNLGAIIWYEKTRGGRSERFKVEDETQRRPGDLPAIPLETLREATRAAEAAVRDGKVLKFRKRREA